MIAWIKSLFKIEGATLPNVSCTIPMPKVKPPKGTNISEPVLTLLKIWNSNKERFKFTYNYYNHSGYEFSRSSTENIDVSVRDKETNEEFTFLIRKNRRTTQWLFGISKENYPVFNYEILTYPNWLTQDELSLLSSEAEKYFKPRVERYIEIKNYRRERSLASNQRKTELNKVKERRRLVNLYTKES